MKFNARDSRITMQNWIAKLVSTLDQQGYLLEVLIDKDKLQPRELGKVKRINKKLAKLACEIEDIIG